LGRAQKRRAPARGLPRLVRITQNALPPRRDTTGPTECPGPMAVLRRSLVDLAFNNKDLGGSPHSP
jgi:hypothetical protein